MTTLTDEKKQRIEALSTEEMVYEVNLGRQSRFQREKFAYLKTTYDLRVRENELKNSISQNQSSNETKKKPEAIHDPRKKALYRVAEGVAIGVLVLFVARVISHYLGLSV